MSNEQVSEFKKNVKEWLLIDEQIKQLQKQAKELRQKKTKVLEPKITLFMVHNNISDLNTESGKLKCSEKITRSGLSSKHIRDNLSNILQDELVVDKAMDQILNNRSVKKTYQIRKVKG
tara:strand:- start:119 stop:475 length:357 start_codon:yes stop_codon:yes gene_type:complete